MHGDHIYGLLGLLTSRSINNSKKLLEIYGSKGIKKFIINFLRITNSYINFPLNIYEINEGEIFNNNKFRVIAFKLNHNLECYGFRIEKLNKIGHLNVKKLINDGIYPGPIYKELKLGKKFYINNKIIDGNNYIGPFIKGKNIVILGDTSPLKNNCKFLLNLDLLIHESTLDHSMYKKANLRGHSTNIQAALLAKKYFVKKLIITHFSSRYNLKDLKKMLYQCNKIFPNTKLAKDFSIFKI